jgi:hypothetical protein
MSNETPDPQFWSMVDSFIQVANGHGETLRSTRVAAAMMFSAARFSAFAVAGAAPSKTEFSARKEENIRFILSQCETMLRENMAEYDTKFHTYLPGKGA